MRIGNGKHNNQVIRNHDIFYAKFKHNGNPNLNVNGSVTPIEFTLEDLPVDNFLLTRVDYLIVIDSIIDVSKFGNRTALSNGLVFEIDGSQVFKNNADVMLFASDSTIDSAKITGTTASIINGNWSPLDVFQHAIISKKSDLKIIVRDDLTPIPHLEFGVSGIKLD